MEKEIRTFNEDVELRAVNDTRTVEGYAIVFNKESRDLGGFKEVVTPESIEGVIEKSDVLALMNHNDSRGVLARSIKGNGSLKLQPDERGVKYSFKAPKTALGEELIEGIQRGDIRGSSFAFRVAPGGDKLERRADGSILRTINKFDEFFDVSPCYREAYQDTTIAVRSLDEFKQRLENGTDNGIVNPPVAQTPGGPLTDDEVGHTLTNAELAQRAKNNYYKHH